MSTAAPVAPAGFLADPVIDDQVRQMYDSDRELQGYVANLTRVWAHSPEALALLSYVLKRATEAAGIEPGQRALLVTATASALGDSYCSMAWGRKLAATSGADRAARVVAGADDGLDHRDRALAAWARRVVRDPSGTTADHVDALRAVGFDDPQIFAVTLFVALRIAFSTVNDALGAAPDVELAAMVPAELLAAVSFGRRPG
ncbi:carboxymuconolactone decarboxylase family protein [Microlunatus ginsengisoli]|uniref:Alkylhydroperoxidase family enzyme, contains CxxC motif n=1 Tax=Microlunatus ginsengisoli TaxID=363863 RepID=A0ABP7AI96_9ACTN